MNIVSVILETLPMVIVIIILGFLFKKGVLRASIQRSTKIFYCLGIIKNMPCR